MSENLIKRFPVTGYFVMLQQWKCNIFNSKSYFKNSIKIVFESLLEGFWSEITKYFKSYFAMLYFFVIYLLWGEKKLRWNMFSYFAMLYFFVIYLLWRAKNFYDGICSNPFLHLQWKKKKHNDSMLLSMLN